MSGTVSYLVTLAGNFAAKAREIATAAQNAAKAVSGFGNSANSAEKAMGALGNKARAMASNFAKSANEIARQRRELDLLSKSADRAARVYNDTQTRMQAQRDFNAANPPPNRGRSFTDRAMGFVGTYYGAKMAVHGVDHLIERAASVDTMRQKLFMSTGGDMSAVEGAYDKAFELSGKYQNTTVAENMKIIDDLRANLPEKMHKIIAESTEPFVRLNSFLKAYQGGKFKGEGDAALQQIGIAIRSGELMGNLSGEDLAAHAQSIAVGRIAFGDKFKLSEYFAAQKTASAAINATDDTFKHIDFPALVQSLGTRAGTGLATLFNKTVGGIMMPQGSANLWDRFGLVNQNQVLYGRGGIVPKSLINNEWLKGGDQVAKNPLEWMLGTVLPNLGAVNPATSYAARSGVKGLDGGAFKAAWEKAKSVDLAEAQKGIESLVEQTKGIDRASLSKVLAGLGYNKNAVMEMEEMVLRAGAIARDRSNFVRALRNLEDFKNYDFAKNAVIDQADRMWQALAGKEFVPYVTDNLMSVADMFKGLGEKIKNDPGLRGGIITAAEGIGAVFAGAIGLKILRSLGKGGLLGAAVFAGASFIQNPDAAMAAWNSVKAGWDTIKAYVQEPLKLNLLWPDGPPEWFKGITSFLEQMRKNSNKALFESPSYAEDYLKGQYGSFYRSGKDWKAELKDEMGIEANRARYMSNPVSVGLDPAVGRFAAPGLAQVQRVAVDTRVAVTAPSSISIQVSGTISGSVSGGVSAPISGSGSAPLSATASQGQALSDSGGAGSAAP